MVALARAGVRVATYGDMIRVPSHGASLMDAKAEGARVELVYSAPQAVELARAEPQTPLVFFATGFETTAVIPQGELPDNFSVYSAHKYVPPAMQVVAALPDTRVQGFLAAGHAAVITGWGLFEPGHRRVGAGRVPGVPASAQVRRGAGGQRHPRRLPPALQRLHARGPGGSQHGEQRGHVPHLVRVRRPAAAGRPRGAAPWLTAPSARPTARGAPPCAP